MTPFRPEAQAVADGFADDLDAIGRGLLHERGRDDAGRERETRHDDVDPAGNGRRETVEECDRLADVATAVKAQVQDQVLGLHLGDLRGRDLQELLDRLFVRAVVRTELDVECRDVRKLHDPEQAIGILEVERFRRGGGEAPPSVLRFVAIGRA